MADVWKQIGTVVGSSSTSEFSFVLKSFKSRVGDVVAVRMNVPGADYSKQEDAIVWGRVLSIERYNPFFPYEAAQELAQEDLSLLDTVLSNSRDQLEAKVLILGTTKADTASFKDIYPLTYPVQPAAEVLYPPAEAIKELLAGGIPGHTPLPVGTLIARSDVGVAISADRVVSRHMAILAMTGGGKTVASRRILRELISIRYPLLILDPHGDYLGLWEKRELFKGTAVRLFYPHIVMSEENRRIVEILIAKMTQGLSEPQKDELGKILNITDPKRGETVADYIERLLKQLFKGMGGADGRKIPTLNAIRRSLEHVMNSLRRMEATNERMRHMLRGLEFEQLPDPEGSPGDIIRPGQVSILYLGGYDHLTQCTIVSILLEALYEHRANLSNRIPPFQTFVEEAHNFIPSSREGTADTPSLETIRKVITEGRKFGTGLVLISQRPSRVDETILSQCNSFLILRLVNPRDQQFVKSVMENLSESDARTLPGFGPGQGIISGQAVRFPLLVKVKMDEDLTSSNIGDEKFIEQARRWKPDKFEPARQRSRAAAQRLAKKRKRRRRSRS